MRKTLGAGFSQDGIFGSTDEQEIRQDQAPRLTVIRVILPVSTPLDCWAGGCFSLPQQRIRRHHLNALIAW